MKAARPANHSSFESRRRDKVVDVWRSLGEPKVGADELRQIKKVLDKESVAAGGVTSPATIARILADEGAELRHPEIIEFDASWREAQIEKEAKGLNSVGSLTAEETLSLKQAESLITRLEKLRQRFERTGNKQSSTQLRTLAIEGRQVAISRAKNRSLAEAVRLEQAEIGEWLRIWLQTPTLFEQWLELRKSSPDFKGKFSQQD
jgi:hypothetical protein